MQYKTEVLQYLGYQGQAVDDQLHYTIEQCWQDTADLAQVRYIVKQFDLCRRQNELLLKPGAVVLTGESIKKHLAESHSCYVLAVTLGSKIEQQLAYYQLTDLTRAGILDAYASVYIEQICDQLTEQIRLRAAQNNLQITDRFSPGYGDFPLTLQTAIIKLLRADVDIGLTVNQHHLLLPRKSITAVIGLQQDSSPKVTKCERCDVIECRFKKSN